MILNLLGAGWYRRAIAKSVIQIRGAERWINQHPDRIFLDRTRRNRYPFACRHRRPGGSTESRSPVAPGMHVVVTLMAAAVACYAVPACEVAITATPQQGSSEDLIMAGQVTWTPELLAAMEDRAQLFNIARDGNSREYAVDGDEFPVVGPNVVKRR
jgi:hypothetical protein